MARKKKKSAKIEYDSLGCHKLFYNDDPGEVDNLVKEGYDINTVSQTGMTPLHYHCLKGNVAIVNKLLFKGAKVNLQDEYGMSSLHYAVINGKKELIESLSAYEADFNQYNNIDYPPLNVALITENKEVIDTLKRYKAQATIENLPPMIFDTTWAKEVRNVFDKSNKVKLNDLSASIKTFLLFEATADLLPIALEGDSAPISLEEEAEEETQNELNLTSTEVALWMRVYDLILTPSCDDLDKINRNLSSDDVPSIVKTPLESSEILPERAKSISPPPIYPVTKCAIEDNQLGKETEDIFNGMTMSQLMADLGLSETPEEWKSYEKEYESGKELISQLMADLGLSEMPEEWKPYENSQEITPDSLEILPLPPTNLVNETTMGYRVKGALPPKLLSPGLIYAPGPVLELSPIEDEIRRGIISDDALSTVEPPSESPEILPERAESVSPPPIYPVTKCAIEDNQLDEENSADERLSSSNSSEESSLTFDPFMDDSPEGSVFSDSFEDCTSSEAEGNSGNNSETEWREINVTPPPEPPVFTSTLSQMKEEASSSEDEDNDSIEKEEADLLYYGQELNLSWLFQEEETDNQFSQPKQQEETPQESPAYLKHNTVPCIYEEADGFTSEKEDIKDTSNVGINSELENDFYVVNKDEINEEDSSSSSASDSEDDGNVAWPEQDMLDFEIVNNPEETSYDTGELNGPLGETPEAASGFWSWFDFYKQA